jgi:hypothetical protein
VASVWLTARLFGTTAAGYFALTNFARLQVSYLGRSEPLAVALGLGSLLAFRWDRIVFTARRKWLGLTGIYSDGPLHGIVVGTLTDPAPWTNLVLSFFWIGLVLLGVGMMFSDNFRKYAKSYPNEAIFCGLYLFAIFSYDYLIWARSNFIGSASRRCRLLFCTVASSAQGPQGDLGPLRGECGGSGSFDSWGEKCVPRGCIEALVKSRTSVRAKSHLFKVAR